jgi:PAS domain S-box-containing protein
MRKARKILEGHRLIISVYLLLIGLLFFIGIKNIIDEREIDRQHNSIVDISIDKLALLRQMRINAEWLQAITIDQSFHPSSLPVNYEKQVDEKLAYNDQGLERLKTLIETRQELNLFTTIQSGWQLFKDSRKKLISLNADEAEAYFHSIEKTAYDGFHDSSNVFSDLTYVNIKAKDARVDSYSFDSELSIDVMLALGIVLLVVVGILVIRNVRKLDANARVIVDKEKTLVETKTLYKELFNKSPLAKWVCDRRTLQIYEINDAGVRLYGYSRAEFLNLTVFDLRLKEDHEQLKQNLQQRDFSRVNHGLRKHRKKNGEIILVEIALDDIIYKGKEAMLVAITDVTEKIHAEETIRQSEELYRSLFNNNPAFIWLCELPSLRHLDVNQVALTHYGYSKEEFLSMTAYDLLPDEDREQLKRRIQQPENESYHGYDRHVKKNGELIFVEIRVRVINFRGKQAGLVIGSDITEKLRAEEKLKEEEEFFRTINENSADIQLVTNKEGLITYASESVYKNFGFKNEDIIGKTSNDFWHPDDALANRIKIQELVKTPGKSVQFETRCLDKGNIYRWCEARISNQLHNPSIRGFVSNYSEITERKFAEEQIRNSEELYRSLFHRSPLPILVADKKRLQYLEVNDMAVELYGYSREEFLELTVFHVRPEEDHKYLQKVVDGNTLTASKNNHVFHIKKNGETMIVDVALDTINYKGEEAYLIIVNDITENLKLQQQLANEKLTRQLEITRATIHGQEKERNELGKELHDNVNQILATAKLYLESAATMPKHQKEFIQTGRDLIVNGIAEIRKISKSLVPPSLGDLTLKEALKDLAEPVKLTKTCIRLNTRRVKEEKLCSDLKISVYRIVQEQLNNIMKYASASEVIINISQTEKELELLVADNGKGFDMTEKRNGIGITNIINRAVTFNGKVTIDSSPGNGCRLSVNFQLPHHPDRLQSLFSETGIESFNQNILSKN